MKNSMVAAWLYRIAAVLFVLFAAGHTFGFLKFKPPSAEGQAVLEAMNRVHFQFGSASLTYGGFYVGFGLYVTVYLLFSAFLAWHLSGLAKKTPAMIGGLGWVFFGVQVAGLVLAWEYFSGPPVVLSVMVAVCLGWAMLAMPKAEVEG